MVVSILALLAAQAVAPTPAEPSIEGRWRSPGGNSIIAIAPCGSTLCGTVDWASDRAKKDARKATNQLVGTQLLTGLQQGVDGRWQGKLYIPDKNLRATAKLQVVGPQQLRVSGCLAGKSLCKTQMWTRATDVPPSAN